MRSLAACRIRSSGTANCRTSSQFSAQELAFGIVAAVGALSAMVSIDTDVKRCKPQGWKRTPSKRNASVGRMK